MRRLWRIAFIVVGILLVVVGGGLAVLKSDLPRLIAEKTASAKLGRAVHLGSLDLAFIPNFRIVVTDVTVANMETGTTPNMVEIARAEAVLDPWKLLRGQVDVTLLALDKPVIVAEKDKQGHGNWQLHPGQSATQVAPSFPVRQLVVNGGRVLYRDPTEKINVGVSVQSQKTEGADADRLVLTGDGQVGTNEFKLSGKADTVLNLANNTDKPYAVELDASVGQTKARVAGSLKEPLRAEGLQADLQLEAHEAHDLYDLTGVAIPPKPPYKLDGKLYREGDIWRLEPFTVQVGQSDLRGTVVFNNGGERPKLTSDLTSKRIRVADFGGSAGAKAGDKKAGESTTEQIQRKAEEKQARGEELRKPPPKPSSDTVIPDIKLESERLKAMDAAVKFRGTRIESPVVPMTEVATEIALDNGVLKVKPLRFGIGEGKIDLTLTLNGQQNPAALSAVMTVTRVPLGDLVQALERKLGQNQTGSGVIGGRAELRGEGNSLKGLLASANGNLGLAMEKGQMGLLLTKLADLHLLQALGVAAQGNKPSPIRCMIVDFEIIDGVMGSRAITIDTPDSNISGEGAINFKTEKIDFRIVPRAKDVELLSGRMPVTISGTLRDYKIRPEATNLIARLGAAAALGVVAPFAVPLAFVDIGLGKDNDCAAMIREINARIEQQKRKGARPQEVPQPSGSSEKPKR